VVTVCPDVIATARNNRTTIPAKRCLHELSLFMVSSVYLQLTAARKLTPAAGLREELRRYGTAMSPANEVKLCEYYSSNRHPSIAKLTAAR
jgi:hypothetical protein